MTATTAPDPAKLRALLDGEHAPTRDRVREWLTVPGNEPVADLPIEEHRAKVLAWATELASQGDTAMGYPVEYGGKDAVGRSVAGFETLAFGDLSLLVKCGVQFGLFGGAVLHLGTERHHERHLARTRAAGPSRLLRDDRDRPRLERPGAAHDRDVRRRRPRSSSSTRPTTTRARTTSAAPPATAASRPCSRSSSWAARRAASTRCSSRSATRTAPSSTASASRTAARSSASTASTTGASGSTTCGSRARRCSTATRGHRGRHLLEPDREPHEALLHDARDAHPGPRERLRRVDQRDEGRPRRSRSAAA